MVPTGIRVVYRLALEDTVDSMESTYAGDMSVYIKAVESGLNSLDGYASAPETIVHLGDGHDDVLIDEIAVGSMIGFVSRSLRHAAYKYLFNP